MVFIDRNGRILERKPWIVSITELISGFGSAIVQFFLTLLAPFLQSKESQPFSRRNRSGWGGGGPGPGGGGGRGNNGHGGGPNRRIGRIVNTSMDCNIPGGG